MEVNPIGKRISMLYRHSQIYINDRLGKYNIGSGQYLFILNLYDNIGINQDKLSEMLKIDKATTARAIKKLEDEGYVIRKVSTQDKRNYEIYVTEKGEALKPIITDVMLSWRKIQLENFTEPEIETLLSLLNKMKDNSIQFFKQDK